MKTDKLGQILKKWDSETTLNPENRKKSISRIMDEISKTGIKQEPLHHKYFIIPKTLVFYSGIAAMLFISTLTYFYFAIPKKHPEIQAIVSVSEKDISEIKKIYSEIKYLFPEGVSWISCENNQLSIKTNGSISETANENNKILIRHIVLKKENGNWKKVLISDVVASLDDLIEFKNKQTQGYLWCHNAGNGVYAVDAKLKIETNGNTINIDYSGGQLAMTPLKIQTIKEDNSEYAVFQNIIKI
jgi:hypothetical protein